MLVERNPHPLKVIGYVWRPMLYAIAVALLATLLRLVWPDDHWLELPFTPVGALAASLAIVIAFRANSAYQRWWEARSLWQSIANSSRALGRQIVAATTDAIAAGRGGSPEAVRAFRDELLLSIAAFAYALCGELRGTDAEPELRRLLPAEDYQRAMAAHRKSNVILTGIAVRLKEGTRAGRIDTAVDPFILQAALDGLHNWAGAAERIKDTPIPCQYSYFSRLFVAIFVTLLPFSLLSMLPGAMIWWLVPLSVLAGGLFILLERTSQIIDSPFLNEATDVPMTAVCVTIERDLREQVGHTDLPPVPQPVNGYLW